MIQSKRIAPSLKGQSKKSDSDGDSQPPLQSLNHRLETEVVPILSNIISDQVRSLTSNRRVLEGTFEDLGKLMRVERKKQGLTGEMLADLTSISRSTLTRFENGHHDSIGADTVARLARALGVALLLK